MMDIDKMEAGRELDALVAERVMGGKIVERANVCRFFYDADGEQLGIQEWFSGEWMYTDLPEYSTDIAAAWRVVEKLRATPSENGDHFEVWLVVDGAFTCAIRVMERNYADEIADTAPLAICRAVLKAAKP